MCQSDAIQWTTADSPLLSVCHQVCLVNRQVLRSEATSLSCKSSQVGSDTSPIPPVVSRVETLTASLHGNIALRGLWKTWLRVSDIELTQDVAARFDHKLYETGIAMSQKERQAEQKLQSLSITTERTRKKAPIIQPRRRHPYGVLPIR